MEFGPGVDEAANRLARGLAARLAACEGVRSAVPSYRSVLVEYDALVCPPGQMRGRIEQALAELDAAAIPEGREVEIPVCYGGEHGPDLEELARLKGMPPDEVVRRHAAGSYLVYCVGFAPGFGYLGGLDPALASPRLATPRVRVPAGSVAIGGEQTGVYPFETPGGWRLIGKTPLRMFDPGRPEASLLRAGDRVTFRPIGETEFERLRTDPAGAAGTGPATSLGRSGPAERHDPPAIRCLAPGLYTTVQDLGRKAGREVGVSPAGAVDPVAMRIANLLVGNAPGAAGLECTLAGPTLEFLRPATFALAGADLGARLDGETVPLYQARFAKAGQRLEFAGPRSGCRCYLAVHGGIAVPEVLGSRSTDTLTGFGGFGGRALRAGDELRVGDAPGDPGDWAGRALPRDLWPEPVSGELSVRVLLGPQDDHFTHAGIDTLLRSEYRVHHRSNRMGLRTDGPAIEHRGGADIVSDGMPPGGIQVPDDGRPIVMLSNRQTMGGYAKIGCVVSADLWRLGQAAPGAVLRFQAVGLDDAHAALRRHSGWLAAVEAALQPGRRFVVRVGGQPFVAHVLDVSE